MAMNWELETCLWLLLLYLYEQLPNLGQVTLSEKFHTSN